MREQRRWAALDRFRPSGRRLRSHFLFEVNGSTIAYCYIRKNACSAFKRMILDQAGYTGQWNGAISYLTSNFAAPSVQAVRAARWRVFVYRDPFERMASLFRNKMIMQDGAVDFLNDFRRVTGSDPKGATFEQFVHHYLEHRPGDPHTLSQAAHLLPISYNVRSTMDSLLHDMKQVVGDELAKRYFGRPVNESSAILFDEPSVDLPVRVLRDRYAESGQLPGSSALETAELRSAVQRLYRADYKLARRQFGRENG